MPKFEAKKGNFAKIWQELGGGGGGGLHVQSSTYAVHGIGVRVNLKIYFNILWCYGVKSASG